MLKIRRRVSTKITSYETDFIFYVGIDTFSYTSG